MSNKKKKVCIVGVPMDLGQSRRGVDMGPSALRYAGLSRRISQLGYDVEDCGNVEITVRDTLPEEGGLSFLPAVAAGCEAAYHKGVEVMDAGGLPIFLGGDHSMALGTVGAASHAERTGVLWVDAHGDFNTAETSPSGNIHGMPLAALTGLGLDELVNLGRPGPKIRPQDIAIIGARDLDPGEKKLLREKGVTVFTMRDIDTVGISTVANQAIKSVSHLPRIHVSLDMDALDPREAPGVGTPVPGGLRYREAHLLMEIIADLNKVTSIDVVEVNPILDHSNRTAELAIELLCSLLGQTIF